MRRNKGITLIALVITIIVLLILAGVAISMLSGENGILRKAAEAKTKTEEAQKEESTTLLDMEIDSYFITNNLKYKCRYGYITGIDVNWNKAETAEKLNSVLDEQGYKLRNIENTADVADDTKLTTGMAVIKKDGNNQEILARTVIFGDVDCSGNIDTNDTNEVFNYLKGVLFAEYQIAAMDVNHDGYIDENNMIKIGDVVAEKEELIQNVYVSNLKQVTKLSAYDIIKNINICEGNSIEKSDDDDWLEEDKYYKIKLLDEEETYKTLSTKIKEVYPNFKITFYDNTSSNNEISKDSEDKIQTGSWLYISTPMKINNNLIPENPYIMIMFK